MRVHTQNSIYELELGEGLTVQFQWLSGNRFGFGRAFEHEPARGVINCWPLVVGEPFSIYRRDNEWPVDEDVIHMTRVVRVEETEPSLVSEGETNE